MQARRMVKTGGIFTLIGKHKSRAASQQSEEKKYAICSIFPEESDIVFDGELRVHLMDG